MRIGGGFTKDAGARSELVLLLAASLACAIVLTVAASGRPDSVGSLKLVHILAIAIAAGVIAAAATKLWRSTNLARRAGQRKQDEIAELRRNLTAAESMLRAEPQVLVYWQHGQNVRIVSHTLTTVPGLPEDTQQLLRFGQWLEPSGAHELKAGLDALFTAGRPFTMLLKTNAGGHVEAEGRVSGGRAILRLRDVAGYRRDLARIIDQHRQLARDISLGRSLFNALPLPVWIRGTDERIEWVNKAYVTAVEAADEEEVRQRQIELLESRQRQELRGALKRGETFNKRLPLIIGGARKAHDVVGLVVGEASAGAAIDAAALETAQDELERLVTAYDRTLRRVTTGVAIFSREQKLTFFNDAFSKLWQLDADWLASSPSHGEILDRLRELSRLPPVVSYRDWKTKVLAGYKTGSEPEEWWHLPDGRSLHVMAEERPDGGITYLYDDATERLALESRYNALIGVQRETLDHLAEGVAVFGMDGRLKLSNSAFERIWKLRRKDLEGGPHVEEVVRLCRTLHDDPKSWDHIFRSVTSISDERQPVEGQMTRADQSMIDFSALPLPDGGTLLTFADVTDAKRYERALIERNEALVAADRLKSQFISHVSYELRTPLTNIIGFTELLESPRTGPLNQKQREYLTDVSASSKTLLSIIDDILDLANMDAGALELKLSTVKVRSVVDAASLGVRDRANRARIALDIAIAEDAVEFVADEARVRQILYNLLSNAIGFSMAGGRVQLACKRDAGMMAFTVIDEGVGIPKDQQRSVLERFVSRSQGSKHRGAGLGLSIVKSLVDLHGGDMLLDSEPGKGTSVTVRFPETGVRPVRTPDASAKRA
jgi:signal transduction histidine kinase